MPSLLPPSPVGIVIADAKRLRESLDRIRARQLWSTEARTHLKAVAFAWFQNYKPSILTGWPAAQVADVDACFQKMLTLSEKTPQQPRSVP